MGAAALQGEVEVLGYRATHETPSYCGAPFAAMGGLVIASQLIKQVNYSTNGYLLNGFLSSFNKLSRIIIGFRQNHV